MNLRLLSPTALLIGLGALVAGLFVLHLLRVRLRRETVDSLLFFRMLGEVQRPRALPGRPARWLAFLLALLAGAAAWTASADPREAPDGTSRVVVLDASRAAAGTFTGDSANTSRSTLRAHFVEQVTALLDARGLGDRGRVVAAGLQGGARVVLMPGEPIELLADRLAYLEPGPAASLWPALHAAADGLLPNDEVVVFGGGALLPERIGDVPVVRPGEQDTSTEATGGAGGILHVALRGAALDRLEVTAFGGTAAAPLALTLEGAPGASPARARFTSALETQSLGPLPAAPLTGRLVLQRAGDPVFETVIELGDRRPRSVRLAADLAPTIPLCIAADPLLEAATESTAAVAAAMTTAIPSDSVPSLVVTDTSTREQLPRQPRRTAGCPLSLSLRDRQRDAGALDPELSYSAVWIEDARTGAPLLARDTAGHLHVVDWLLDDAAHRDVPALVGGCLRHLTGIASAGILETVNVEAPPAVAHDSGNLADFEDKGGTPWLAQALLALALLLLAADMLLFARGRLP